MDRQILNGIKFGIGIFISLSVLFGLVFAVGFHTTSEILPGIFTGDYTFNGDLKVNGSLNVTENFQLSNTNQSILNSSLEIFFNNSMDAQAIQDRINQLPKYIPEGLNVYLKFKDGTYTINQTIQINGFYGGGRIYVYGNITEPSASSLHTTQQVILDGSSTDTSILFFRNNDVYIQVRNFRINVKTNSNNYIGAYVENSKYTEFYYNYITGNGFTFGYALMYDRGSSGYAVYNYFSNIYIGIYATNNAVILSNVNDDTGTLPQYGLYSSASIIMKSGTQPAANTAAETTVNGGVIR